MFAVLSKNGLFLFENRLYRFQEKKILTVLNVFLSTLVYRPLMFHLQTMKVLFALSVFLRFVFVNKSVDQA